MKKLQLGVGRSVITPEIGCHLSGYRYDIFSESVHDDLTATAFWFCYGETQALMVNLTVCNLSYIVRDILFDAIEKQEGLSRGAVMLSCTHTHSGPITGGKPNSPGDWGRIDRPYVENIFIPRVLEAIAEAHKSLRFVEVGIGAGDSRIGINRRQITAENKVILGQNPWASYDPRMTVLSFRDESGATYANIVHCACHGTCAGKHTAISRDWSGIMVDRMEHQTGGITAFFNGTAGDTGPRLSNGFTTGRGDFQYVYELGNVAAQDAISIWRGISAYGDAPLQTACCSVDLPLNPRESLEEAERLLATPIEGGTTLQNAHPRHYRQVIESYQNGYEEQEYDGFDQVLIRVGDAAFYGIPFEPFSGIGLRVREYCNVPHPLCLGYTNGSQGYFPTLDQVPLGGYEVLIRRYARIQPYADNADFYLIKNTVENLKKVYN